MIAVDYDKTYNSNPALYSHILELINAYGEQAVIVTCRYDSPEERIKDYMPCKVYYTNRMAKRTFMESIGIPIAIWIDDNPASIYQDQL